MPSLHFGREAHAGIADFCLFLHDHRLGPCWDRRACHDTYAGTGWPVAVERSTSKSFARDRQRRVGLQIGEAHGIAVHGRIGEGRYINRRNNRRGGNAAGGGGQGNGFGLLKGGDLAEHLLQRLLQGNKIGSMAMIHKELRNQGARQMAAKWGYYEGCYAEVNNGRQ